MKKDQGIRSPDNQQKRGWWSKHTMGRGYNAGEDYIIWQTLYMCSKCKHISERGKNGPKNTTEDIVARIRLDIKRSRLDVVFAVVNLVTEAESKNKVGCRTHQNITLWAMGIFINLRDISSSKMDTDIQQLQTNPSDGIGRSGITCDTKTRHTT